MENFVATNSLQFLRTSSLHWNEGKAIKSGAFGLVAESAHISIMVLPYNLCESLSSSTFNLI